MSIFTPFDPSTRRIPPIPTGNLNSSFGGGIKTYDIQDDANAGIMGPKIPSNRDDQSYPDANGNVTHPMMIDLSNYMPGDVNQGEILFAINNVNSTSLGHNDLNGAERIMGLARLNEWLRTSREGITFGKSRHALALMEVITLRGVLITSMEQTMLQKGVSKEVTIVLGGRATTPDVTAWTRSNFIGRPRDETQVGDHISICFRRIVNPKQLQIDEAEQPYPYWQAFPHRHADKTPERALWASIPYKTTRDEEFFGFYMLLGIVREVINGHDHNKHGVNQKAFDYNFGKTARNMSHIGKFNELPKLEIYMTMAI